MGWVVAPTSAVKLEKIKVKLALSACNPGYTWKRVYVEASVERNCPTLLAGHPEPA
jgi:hypothetical protein